MSSWRRCRAKTRCKLHIRSVSNQLPDSSVELADGAQETSPALPFRYPGNLIREHVSYFGQRLPIPMRENFGFVTQTHAALGTLWHRCRLLNCHSGFCAHCLTLTSAKGNACAKSNGILSD